MPGEMDDQQRIGLRQLRRNLVHVGRRHKVAADELHVAELLLQVGKILLEAIDLLRWMGQVGIAGASGVYLVNLRRGRRRPIGPLSGKQAVARQMGGQQGAPSHRTTQKLPTIAAVAHDSLLPVRFAASEVPPQPLVVQPSRLCHGKRDAPERWHHILALPVIAIAGRVFAVAAASGACRPLFRRVSSPE